ncbi:LysE family translocator [Actinoplanes siamensis]|uniref:LysE family translocator n=1 Tax=Actinoplanes siamensis TaxID=1223317 RepID=UPI0019404ABF|nr:LysE family translocator [Actinoplanes siamensis]
MVGLDQIIALGLACVLLIVVPGPSVLFVVGRALTYGRATALATAAGNSLGTYLVAACVAFGLGPLLERSTMLFTAVRWAGAAYLIWLGVQAWRHARHAATPDTTAAAGTPLSRWHAVRAGTLVGITNPKAFIILAAVLPQFVDRAASDVPVQLLALALVPVLVGLLTDSVWGLAADAARGWFARSPRRLVVAARAGGASMIGLGVSVAVGGQAR